MTLPKKLTIKNRDYDLPIFCPDATRAVVRSLDSKDIEKAMVRGVIINTWHLHELPGEEKMAALGGIKKFMNFDGLTISDSGGFQVFSLFQQQPDFGKITDEGLVTYTGKNKQKKLIFTPENSIQMQFAIGSDIMIVLDDFTPIDANEERADKSIERTIDWARRCKVEFEKQCEMRDLDEQNRPHLYGVIQGHRDPARRKSCADQLLEIGFDGYGCGGWLFNDEGKLDLEIAALNASLTPDEFPRYA
ncbi:MAG: queuine tRNA-ribosyltransferase family protein, partial [Pseudomonadales bacterium]|nr:queuine tRNA-ribosyltransferase family protein [Pseudomonadales bacterium]